MTANELRKKYIEFFKSKNHVEIPSASLIPENDPSVLFTTAGMHPLVPYLMGEEHPQGARLVDYQKCVRTGDIDEVGDNTHLTFFEMLGNWSLGDYFKQESIEWSWEFLTSSEWLGIDPSKLAVSVFKGDNATPLDQESFDKWVELGISENRIAKLGKDDNWWPAGGKHPGPQGPDTEIFYWTGTNEAPKVFDPDNNLWVEIWNNVFMQNDKKDKSLLIDGMDCLYDENFVADENLLSVLNKYPGQKILVVNGFGDKARELLSGTEIEVFTFEQEIKKDEKQFFEKLMKQFSLKTDEILYFDHAQENLDGAGSAGINQTQLHALGDDIGKVKNWIDNNGAIYTPLAKQNVDTGMGLERTVAVLQGKASVYETELFTPILSVIPEGDELSRRIIADHVRTAVMMIADGITPSNKDQGYVLRRLIRRAVRNMFKISSDNKDLSLVAESAIKSLEDAYSELKDKKDQILDEIKKEEEKFQKTVEKGLKEIKKLWDKKKEITGDDAFNFYQSYGFPLELTEEVASEFGQEVDRDAFEAEFKKHQDLSRAGAGQKFAGGLADDSIETTRLHTATHLLHQALRQVLGSHVEQRGSNINKDRLRFDFTHDKKMTDEERVEVEKIVNNQINKDLKVRCEMMAVDEAKKAGAIGLFEDKYENIGDRIKVYTVGSDDDQFSREICGGPHVERTSELGEFKIKKEEASSAGIRRIKAVLK